MQTHNFSYHSSFSFIGLDAQTIQMLKAAFGCYHIVHTLPAVFADPWQSTFAVFITVVRLKLRFHHT